MRNTNPRRYRTCFRHERYVYWRIHDLARDLEITQSAVVRLLVQIALHSLGTKGWSETVQWFLAMLPPDETAEFQQAVEKLRDKEWDLDVPW